MGQPGGPPAQSKARATWPGLYFRGSAYRFSAAATTSSNDSSC